MILLAMHYHMANRYKIIFLTIVFFVIVDFHYESRLELK